MSLRNTVDWVAVRSRLTPWLITAALVAALLLVRWLSYDLYELLLLIALDVRIIFGLIFIIMLDRLPAKPNVVVKFLASTTFPIEFALVFLVNIIVLWPYCDYYMERNYRSNAKPIEQGDKLHIFDVVETLKKDRPPLDKYMVVFGICKDGTLYLAKFREESNPKKVFLCRYKDGSATALGEISFESLINNQWVFKGAGARLQEWDEQQHSRTNRRTAVPN